MPNTFSDEKQLALEDLTDQIDRLKCMLNQQSTSVAWQRTDYRGDILTLDNIKYIPPNAEGVYVILENTGIIRTTLYIGRGEIKNRLNDHTDATWSSIYNRVVWAEVSDLNQRGVEKYLHHRLNPKYSNPDPGNYLPITVELPW